MDWARSPDFQKEENKPLHRHGVSHPSKKKPVVLNKIQIRTSSKSNLPIYTLPAPRSRIYVATDVALISEMHRKSKTLQFGPYVERFEARVCGVSKAGTAVLTKPGDEATLFEKMTRLLHTDLAQGSELNGANKQLTRHIQSALDRFPTSPTKVRLLEWLRYEMSIGTCRAIWGPENPVNCREMVDAFLCADSSLFLSSSSQMGICHQQPLTIEDHSLIHGSAHSNPTSFLFSSTSSPASQPAPPMWHAPHSTTPS